MSTYQQYLKTLRRVPDDEILSVATREMEMTDGKTCLCGWVIREHIARITGQAPEDVYPYNDAADFGEAWSPDERCAEFFGGSRAEWNALYEGVYKEPAPLIERAFVERVLECV